MFKEPPDEDEIEWLLEQLNEYESENEDEDDNG